MAASIADIQPLVLKDVELILDLDGEGATDPGTDFRKHVNGVMFTPSASSITWTGLGKNSHTDVSTATWVCQLDYVQDWDSATSLSGFLFDNEGKSVTVTFRPRSGVGPSFKSVVTITPGAIGGQVNAYAPASVQLGCTKPERVAA